MKIVTSAEMKALEQASEAAGVSTRTLMENAGLAVAREVRSLRTDIRNARVLVLVGPGNNGGDGLVAAHYLAEYGASVSVYLPSPRTEDDINYLRVVEEGISVLHLADDQGLRELNRLLGDSQIVVDSLFGTGASRPISGPYRQALAALKEARERRPGLTLLGVDLPSGLNADTGQVDPACVPADVTVTLGCPKIGLFRFPAASYTGKLVIADIGLPAGLDKDIRTELITPGDARARLPRRPPDSNKGTFGRLLVAAGSRNYVGAAYLAAQGALRVGAGLVALATPESIHGILAAKLTEAIYFPLAEDEKGRIEPPALEELQRSCDGYQAVLVGCGLGRSANAQEIVRRLVVEGTGRRSPLIIDADALNILSSVPGWWRGAGAGAIISPHPGEMGRLLNLTVEEVQADRLSVALRAAARFKAIVVLKGAFTVVASPEGRAWLAPFANPGLATAGTGDVLAGAMAGLAAQGLAPIDAAIAGVYLHGAAGELARQQLGDAGIIASDLLPLLPKAIKDLKETR